MHERYAALLRDRGKLGRKRLARRLTVDPITDNAANALPGQELDVLAEQLARNGDLWRHLEYAYL